MTTDTFDAFVCASLDVIHAYSKRIREQYRPDLAQVLACHELNSAYVAATQGELVTPTRIMCDPRVVSLYASHALREAFTAIGQELVPTAAQAAFLAAFAPALKVKPKS